MDYVNNVIDIPEGLGADKISVVFHGSNNRVVLRSPLFISRVNITFYGDNNTISIFDDCILNEVYFILGRGANVEILAGSQFNGPVSIMTHEGASISIGKKCLFGHKSTITASDMHPIYDSITNERLNPPGDIVISDRVWIGFDALILKGASIGEGSVIGAKSVVSGEIPSSVVWAGIGKGKVLKTNVRWDFK